MIHSIFLWERKEGYLFILSEDTQLNNTSVDKNQPQAWPVMLL